MYIYDNMLLNSSRNKNVSEKELRNIQNTYFIVSNIFFPENRGFYEIMWKDML